MTAEEMPAHAPYLPIPYEHHWRSPDEQLSASRDFLVTMARRRTVRDFAPDPGSLRADRERRPRRGPRA